MQTKQVKNLALDEFDLKAFDFESYDFKELLFSEIFAGSNFQFEVSRKKNKKNILCSSSTNIFSYLCII